MTPHPGPAKERAALVEVAERLRRRFPDLERDVIDQAVATRYAELAGAPIRDFIPVLVERAARSDLERG